MKKWQPQNFRLINREDSSEKGVCYEESKQTWVTLHKHISLEDIYATCMEETVHQCLSMFNLGAISNIEQEEWFVEQVFWVYNDWILMED